MAGDLKKRDEIALSNSVLCIVSRFERAHSNALTGGRCGRVIFLRPDKCRRNHPLQDRGEADAAFHSRQLGVIIGTVEYDLVGQAVARQASGSSDRRPARSESGSVRPD